MTYCESPFFVSFFENVRFRHFPLLQNHIISSLCSLIARSASVSVIAAVLFLPALIVLPDKNVTKTTLDLRKL